MKQKMHCTVKCSVTQSSKLGRAAACNNNAKQTTGHTLRTRSYEGVVCDYIWLAALSVHFVE